MKALIGRIPKLALAGLALVVGGAIAVAAYAASDGGSSSSAAAGADQAAMQAFQQCLSEHGVTPPQPGSAPPSGQRAPSGQPAASAKLRRAFQACRQYAPAGGMGSGTPPSGVPPSGAPPSGLPVPTPGS
jgi:hypothetical protein